MPVALFILGVALAPTPAAALDTDTVQIALTSGEKVDIKVEVAKSEEEMAHGLMYRKDVPPGRGMLFVIEPPRAVAFWMKNTFVPLDMLFIEKGGKIVKIITNTEPFSTRPLPSDLPVAKVIEVRGGEAARLGIKPGDHLINEE